jgi:hypothetical protein
MAVFQPPPPRTDLKWVSVDFDNTLCVSEPPTYSPGEPIVANIRQLEWIKRYGFKIVIYTARPWSEYETVESWLLFHGVPFDMIQCGKLLTVAHFDDRAYNASEPDWLILAVAQGGER